MMGVGFPVHHVGVCQRLLLCFLTPMFCDNLGGLTWGKSAMEGLWTSKALPACVSPWNYG